MEIVRRAYAAFRDRELELLRSLLAPDVVLRASPATDGAEHRGLGAMDEILEAIDARWEQFRVDPLEFYDGGTCVLVLGTIVTKGRQESDLRSVAGQVWKLQDGKVTSIEAFLDSDSAIRAAGLTRLLT